MILLKIQNQSSRFTPAECKIASFVLSNPQAAMGMTAAQLAEKCSVAPSAIIRFCKSIGLSGFSELKIRLAQESVSREKTDELPSPPSGEGAEGVARRVFQSGMQTLKNTMDMLDVKKLEEMADTLSLAKRIFIFGVGTSSVVASDAQYRLAQLGLDAHCCTDILFMNVTAVNLTPDDAVLCISHSGQTKAVVSAMRHAKKSGANTLAITSFPSSILYRESRLALSVFADEINYPVEAVSARMAHICLIDALSMVLASKNPECFAEHIIARNQILREIRYE